MIGMMYLFYTALLALNVSGEVINAFVKIDDSIKKTTEISISKAESLYSEIRLKSQEQAGKYTELVNQTNNIKQLSDNVFNDINRLKLMIIQGTEGEDATLDSEIKKKDDLNVANEIMNGTGGPLMGDSLRFWIEDYKKRVLDITPDSARSAVNSVLENNLAIVDQLENTEEKMTWQQTFTQGMPLIGTIALLSKLQADIKNAEGDILSFLIKDLEGLDIRITELEGLVNSPKSFIIRGGQYNSTVFLGARDTTMRPTIHLTYEQPFYDSIVDNGRVTYQLRTDIRYDTLPLDETGKGVYNVNCNNVGNFAYGGLVHYKSNRGDMWLPYKAEYQVGEAGFTVSATKCNVFYKGLDNPVEVAVSGYPKENVNVSISGGASISPAPGGGYIVRVPQSVTAKSVSISVSARTEEGVKTLGSKDFNVLNVPPPTILVAGAYKDGAQVPKVAITNSPFLTARLESDFFPFEGVSYSVAKFDFIYNVRGVAATVTVNGANFNEEVLGQIRRMGQGSQLTFSNIDYNGPSGRRSTNGVTVIIR